MGCRQYAYAAAPFLARDKWPGLRETLNYTIRPISLAWKHISERQKRERPNIARRLHDSIRRLLKDGETEPVFIASEALKALAEEK